MDTQLQICNFVKTQEESIHFNLVDIQQQPDCNSCGLYAIANAVELAAGKNPSLCNWLVAQMREHLIGCLENQKMTAFPRDSRARKVASQYKRSVKKTIYCICRTVNDKNKAMVKCCECRKWFHYTCVGYSENDSEEFHCTTCRRQSDSNWELNWLIIHVHLFHFSCIAPIVCNYHVSCNHVSYLYHPYHLYQHAYLSTLLSSELESESYPHWFSNSALKSYPLERTKPNAIVI